MDRQTEEHVDRRIGQVRRLYEDHGGLFRVMWLAAAAVVVVAGVAMVVFPGPSFVVLPAGLVMLAGVFGWARRLLKTSVESGLEVKSRFDDAPRAVRLLGFAASACVAAAAIALPLLL